MAATLAAGASCGITIVAGTARMRAASATACAWLPDEYATTPARRCSGVNRDRALSAPRNLNAPTRCRFSHLNSTWAPTSASTRDERQHRRAVGVARDPGGRGPDVLDSRGHFPALVQIVTGVPGARLPCGLSPTTWPCGSDDGIGRSRVG